MKLSDLTPDQLVILKRCIEQGTPMHQALAAISDRLPSPTNPGLYDPATWDKIEAVLGRNGVQQ